jgi:hypothetical protein
MPAKKSEWEKVRERSSGLLKNLEQLARDVEKLVSEEGDPLRGAGILQAEVARWETAGEPLIARARQALLRLQKNRDSAAETYEHRLARELGEKGLSVHGETSLLIVEGIVHVETDPGRATVRINGMTLTDLSPGSVVTAVAEEVERIRRLLTPPAELLGQIAAAYDRELKLADRAGSQVQTLALLPHLALLRQRSAFMQNPSAANYREYPRELFRADLYNVLRSGDVRSGARQLRYASGSDTVGAIFMMVPALGRPAHVGRIWFEAAA